MAQVTQSLSGRTALVTGSGIGIGRAIALELALQGAQVALHYAHSSEGALSAVKEIEQAGGKAIAVSGNLSVVADCRRIVDEVASHFGGLDILVNNAGVTKTGDFRDFSEEMFNQVFHLNIRGYFFCAQQAVKYMQERGKGTIINITSVHGANGFPGHAAYASTKGAIIAFTRELAIELAPLHIRVNAVGPGLIEVPRYFDMPDYTPEFGDSIVPLGRRGKPEDIGPTVAFLASDAADFITGQVLYIDGGTNARMGLWWEKDKKMS